MDIDLRHRRAAKMPGGSRLPKVNSDVDVPNIIPCPVKPISGRNVCPLKADQMTQLKIVVVSLVCATVVAGIGIAARVTDGRVAGGRLEASVIKPGSPRTAAATGIVIR